jgi:archaellum component FlaF (FlaF/FlaG flagellin family)
MSVVTGNKTENVFKSINITQQLINILVAILTAFGVVYAFIYNTKQSILMHDKEINRMSEQVDNMEIKISKSEINNSVYNVQIKNVEDRVVRIEEKMDKIDEKLDRILMHK